MEISRLSERIIIQKNEPYIDVVGNHVNIWVDYFACAAFVDTKSDRSESEKAGTTVSGEKCVFTVRYCSELSGIDSVHFRVLFHENAYNILAVDLMNFDRKSIKITCERER